MALAAPAALAYSNIYFFGDSLTDTGAFGGQTIGSTTLPANARWTFNYGPIYADVLAQKLGLSVSPSNAATGKVGNNYAQGGAISTSTVTQPGTPANPNDPGPGGLAIRDLPLQVQDYLAAHGGRADPNAAYVVWIGGNDIPIAAASASPTAILQQSAASTVTQVATLQALGAGVTIVPNLPNIGLTPDAVYAGIGGVITNLVKSGALPAAQAAAANAAAQQAAWQVLSQGNTSTAAAQQAAYQAAALAVATALGQPSQANAVAGAIAQAQSGLGQLSGGFNALTNLGLSGLSGNLVRPDIAALFNEIIASPTQYGFTNVTGSICLSDAILCNSQTAAAGGNPGYGVQHYLFTDGLHPTPEAHAIIGQYIYSLLAAPTFAAALPETGVNASRQLGDALTTRYQALRATPRPVGTVSGFASGGWRPDSLDYDNLSGKTKGQLLTLGIDFQATDTLTLGAAFAAGKGDNSVDNQGNFDSRQQLMALLASWKMDRYWVDGDLHVGNGDIDTHRQVTLGPLVRTMNGSTRLNQYGWRVNGGYQFDVGPVQTGPLVGLDYVKVRVGGVTEDGNLSTSMNFNKQDESSFLGKVGWQVQATLGQFTPYANASWVHEFRDDARSVSVGLNTQPGLFTTTLGKPDSDWAEWKLGASANLTKTINAYGELSTTSGRSTGNLHAVTVGLAASF
ncbi:autotransporter domain-containing protein [Neisseriaceae bacterium JH1-16]|nr:autotransporter domain-containing protein [Neisseriaceae bacterium JH1-16]